MSQDLPEQQGIRVLLDLPALLDQLVQWATLAQQVLLEQLGPPDQLDPQEPPEIRDRLALLDQQVLKVLLETQDLLDLLDLQGQPVLLVQQARSARQVRRDPPARRVLLGLRERLGLLALRVRLAILVLLDRPDRQEL